MAAGSDRARPGRRFALPLALTMLGGLGALSSAWAAGAVEGAVDKQGLNVAAIGMFFLFVLGTLFITYRAAVALGWG